MPTSVAESPTRIYYPDRPRFLLIAAGGWLLLSLLVAIWIMSAFVLPMPLGLILILLFGLPGVTLLLIGRGHLKLRIELREESLQLLLPHAGNEPWLPWKVHQATIPWDDIRRIEVYFGSHPYATGGKEKRAIFRTHQGDFYLHSVWFSEFTEILGEIQQRSGAERTEEDVASLQVPKVGEPRRKVLCKERLLHAFGWAVAGFFLFACLVAVQALVFYPAESWNDAVFLLFLCWLLFPGVMLLTRYRMLA